MSVNKLTEYEKFIDNRLMVMENLIESIFKSVHITNDALLLKLGYLKDDILHIVNDSKKDIFPDKEDDEEVIKFTSTNDNDDQFTIYLTEEQIEWIQENKNYSG